MNIYLSQMTMPLELALQNGQCTCYDWHKYIWKSFPERPNAKRDFLYRVDVNGQIVRVLLLSAVPPLTDIGFETKQISESFLSYDKYRFQLRANPTFRRCQDRRRIPIYNTDKINEWFRCKLKKNGCEIVAISTDSPQEANFYKQGCAGKLVAVDAQGIIYVNDHQAFVKGFLNGIGPAKGFGFGMLMLQPIQK